MCSIPAIDKNNVAGWFRKQAATLTSLLYQIQFYADGYSLCRLDASSVIYLLNNKRAEISFVENKYNIKLNFCIDKDATSDSYSIEKVKLSDKYKALDLDDAPVLQDTSEIYNEFSDNSKSTQNKTKQKIERIANVSTSKDLYLLQNHNLSQLSPAYKMVKEYIFKYWQSVYS